MQNRQSDRLGNIERDGLGLPLMRLAADHQRAVEAERQRIADEVRHGSRGMYDVVGPQIRAKLADLITGGR